MGWESTFESWAKPPGETEQAKCDNALRAIRKAIDAGSTLSEKSVRAFAQGSYCNRTNVRQDSDVDVCVLCDNSFFYDLPEGMTSNDFEISTASYSYSVFKNDVGNALTSYFDDDGVKRGKKAFDIHENTYRIDADAVPCFEYRRYDPDGSYLTGVAFVPDSGSRIINWPTQHYENGVAKNKLTGQRFKDVVRIMKRLRNKMVDDKIEAAESIPSFLIECMVWNVPNDGFGDDSYDTYSVAVRNALAHLFNNTLNFDDCKEWGEINELKYLFRTAQPWTLDKAHAFTSAAWDYIGFE
jgi:hypothetical protein